jgi:ATP-dependent exoDNAse (exonuclease V) beta subunit
LCLTGERCRLARRPVPGSTPGLVEIKQVVLEPTLRETQKGSFAARVIFDKSAWERALAAEERHTEVLFALRFADDGESGAEQGPIILHGIIDLAFRTADGWELVDYKTDQVDAESLVELYGDQVRQYAKHWAALAGAPVKYAGLYSVRGGQCTRNLMEE